MANCNIVGRWANEEVFYDLEQRGLICWGGLTAGCWQYIGSQGVLQGTYEILARRRGPTRRSGPRAADFFSPPDSAAWASAQPRAGLHARRREHHRRGRSRARGQAARERRRPRGHRLAARALEAVARAMSERRAWAVALVGNAADVYPAIAAAAVRPRHRDRSDRRSRPALRLRAAGLHAGRRAPRAGATTPRSSRADGLRSIGVHVRGDARIPRLGAIVFDNGNLIRSQAVRAGVTDAFDIPVFTEAFLRPLFCEGIGPFRWIALSGDGADIRTIDDYLLEAFAHDASVTRWIRIARDSVPFEGLPARIAWLGHGARTTLGLAVNDMVRDGTLKGPIAFTRDHLDAGGHGSPEDHDREHARRKRRHRRLAAAQRVGELRLAGRSGRHSLRRRRLRRLHDQRRRHAHRGWHRRGGGRLRLTLTNDTSLGVLRYADAGYEEAKRAAEKAGLRSLSP